MLRICYGMFDPDIYGHVNIDFSYGDIWISTGNDLLPDGTRGSDYPYQCWLLMRSGNIFQQMLKISVTWQCLYMTHQSHNCPGAIWQNTTELHRIKRYEGLQQGILLFGISVSSSGHRQISFRPHDGHGGFEAGSGGDGALAGLRR